MKPEELTILNASKLILHEVLYAKDSQRLGPSTAMPPTPFATMSAALDQNQRMLCEQRVGSLLRIHSPGPWN